MSGNVYESYTKSRDGDNANFENDPHLCEKRDCPYPDCGAKIYGYLFLSHMVYHRKNYTGMRFTCEYNPRHCYIPQPEIKLHMIECDHKDIYNYVSESIARANPTVNEHAVSPIHDQTKSVPMEQDQQNLLEQAEVTSPQNGISLELDQKLVLSKTGITRMRRGDSGLGEEDSDDTNGSDSDYDVAFCADEPSPNVIAEKQKEQVSKVPVSPRGKTTIRATLAKTAV